MKTAYVLSGGGAKGAFQVGAMSHLDQVGVKPDMIFGTSVGALNAAGYVYAGMNELVKIWERIEDRGDILSLNWWKIFWAQGAYSTKPLRKIIDKVTAQPPVNAAVEAVVTRVNLETGELQYVPNSVGPKDFAVAVESSTSIPLAMEPVNKKWIDGGARDVAPLKRAIEAGCEKIYVILCNPLTGAPLNFKVKTRLLAMAYNAYQAVDILQNEVWRNDVAVCQQINKNLSAHPGKKAVELVVYAPDVVKIDTLEFDPLKIQMVMNQGYETAANRPKGVL